MSLNIKNERVHELAREAARRTGTNQTSAIEAALERYLRDVAAAEEQKDAEHDRRTDEILADMRGRLRQTGGLTLTTDDLYDETGLPA